MESFSIFEKEAKEVVQIYDDLTYSIEDNCPILHGSINLTDEKGFVQDKYEIKVKPKDNYPFSFPYVFETGDRIPKNYDWHIFEDIGNFCIASQPEEILACKKGLTLIGFIENQVKPYLFNQTFRRKHGYFLNERSHGDKGWIEFFETELKTNNINNIIFALDLILKRKFPDRRSDCFCGSEKKFRNCHKDAYVKLNELNDFQLNHYIDKLERYKNLLSLEYM